MAAASDFDDMKMTDGPGRTYKYLKDPSLALWPFGWGLSYTTFQLADGRLDVPLLRVGGAHDALRASIRVTNTGAVGGDEVVFLFKNSSSAERRWAAARGEARPDLPQRELIGFERVTLAPWLAPSWRQAGAWACATCLRAMECDRTLSRLIERKEAVVRRPSWSHASIDPGID